MHNFVSGTRHLFAEDIAADLSQTFCFGFFWKFKVG